VPQGLQVLALFSPAGEAESSNSARHYVVLGPERDSRLLALFSHLDVRRHYGRVWLVGFGPGDPSLMTIKAHRALSAAGVIFYDDLIDPAALARYRARRVYVGKRKGRSNGRQQAINRMLYEAAVQGETVVRLKGGDPFVLGRGGEELEYLERRFVAVEIVPGVTSALAAAADFGIPVTRRGMSRGLEIRTGHEACPDVRPGVCETSAYYMAASRLPELGRELIEEGFDPKLPVAIVEKASLPEKHCRITTVGSLDQGQAEAPALLLVGESVRFATRKPTLLYTGLSPYRFPGPERLVHYPLIRKAGKRNSDRNAGRRTKLIQPLPQARIDLGSFDGVVFTHELAVQQFLDIWGSLPGLVYATSRAVWRRLRRESGPFSIVCTGSARVLKQGRRPERPTR